MARWLDLMDACEQLLLDGLRRKLSPGGDLAQAHRDWYARQMEAHDQMMIQLAEQLNRRSGGHGR